jgi:hypothetical protein
LNIQNNFILHHALTKAGGMTVSDILTLPQQTVRSIPNHEMDISAQINDTSCHSVDGEEGILFFPSPMPVKKTGWEHNVSNHHDRT